MFGGSACLIVSHVVEPWMASLTSRDLFRTGETADAGRSWLTRLTLWTSAWLRRGRTCCAKSGDTSPRSGAGVCPRHGEWRQLSQLIRLVSLKYPLLRWGGRRLRWPWEGPGWFRLSAGRHGPWKRSSPPACLPSRPDWGNWWPEENGAQHRFSSGRAPDDLQGGNCIRCFLSSCGWAAVKISDSWPS